MISFIQYVESEGTNPYANLALEELLLSSVPAGGLILYLWQNDNTVVIGRNQNCNNECNVSALENSGGHLARRMTGGGAVYHDLGNLNFSFIAAKTDYDQSRQASVIMEAVRMLGLDAKLSGRNDITVEGRKFSGNAFYHGINSLHHGTILISTDLARMHEVLDTSTGKIKAKGVESVKSVVCNLSELKAGVTVSLVREKLKEATAQIYNAPIVSPGLSGLDGSALEKLTAKYSSPEWRYGISSGKRAFDLRLRDRFSWGGVELCFIISNGTVQECSVFSDAMDADAIARLPKALKGAAFNFDALSEALRAVMELGAMLDDLVGLLPRN